MNPIERPGTNGIGQRLAAASAAAVAPKEKVRAAGAATAEAPTAGVIPPSAGDSATVDTDRVTMIRKAIEEGRYPVVPTRIADAMIAAGFLLRTKE